MHFFIHFRICISLKIQILVMIKNTQITPPEPKKYSDPPEPKKYSDEKVQHRITHTRSTFKYNMECFYFTEKYINLTLTQTGSSLYLTTVFRTLKKIQKNFTLFKDIFVNTAGKNEENLRCTRIFKQELSYKKHRTMCQEASRTKKNSLYLKVYVTRSLPSNSGRISEIYE